jgi:molybdenum cofactor cytidylyltransferase
LAEAFKIRFRARPSPGAAEVIVIAGVILSAGASTRMGSSKALLDYRGETFVGRLVRVFSETCDPVVVVLGYSASRIQPHLENLRDKNLQPMIALNPAPERGQFSSMQTGLRSVPADAEGFLFAPVDCPAFESSTVRQIVSVFATRDDGKLLVVPRFEGRRGHPVCAAKQIMDEMLALPPTASAREVIHAHVDETIYIDVNDPGILTDVDDPEAYRLLEKRS